MLEVSNKITLPRGACSGTTRAPRLTARAMAESPNRRPSRPGSGAIVAPA
jgi:hypothetical protein